jgi:MoxR-like ATPase
VAQVVEKNVETIAGLTMPDFEHDLWIKDQLREKNDQGDYKTCVVIEEVNGPGDEKKTLLHFGNPYQGEELTYAKMDSGGNIQEEKIKVEGSSEIHYVTLESQASKDEIEAILSKMIPIPETFKVLVDAAEIYLQKKIGIFEGPTAASKTFSIEMLAKLLWGTSRAKPYLDFYCKGQTELSDLMGRWVPKNGTNGQAPEQLKTFLESDAGARTIGSALGEAVKLGIDDEKQLEEFVSSRVQDIAADLGVRDTSEWYFQLGIAPKAMICTIDAEGNLTFPKEGGEGCILHIEEVGMAKPNVTNAFFQFRGHLGKVAEAIEIWEDGGRTIKAGDKFRLFFSTNTVEKHLDRNPLDAALERASRYVRINRISKEAFEISARTIFAYAAGNEPEDSFNRWIDLRKFPELGQEIAKIVSEFHLDLYLALENHGEAGRQQRIELTIDHMARVAEHIMDAQVIDSQNKRVDLPETLRRGIEDEYLERLGTKLHGDMRTKLTQIMSADISKKHWPDASGPLMTPEEIINKIIDEAFGRARKAVQQEAIKKQLETASREGDLHAIAGILDTIEDMNLDPVFLEAIGLEKLRELVDEQLGSIDPEN